MALVLATDKSFSMIAGNEFAAGMLTGTYSVTSDILTMNVTGPTDRMNLDYAYKWLEPDEIQVTDPITKGTQKLTRQGPVLQTAKFDATTDPKTITPQAIGASPYLVDSTTCSSNLKQIGTAMLLYASDYNAFPLCTNWQEKLSPYLGSTKLTTCPTLAKQGQTGGYAMNEALSGVDPKTLSGREGIVLVFEVSPGISSAPDSQMLTAPRHTTVGVVYADGHFKNQPR